MFSVLLSLNWKNEQYEYLRIYTRFMFDKVKWADVDTLIIFYSIDRWESNEDENTHKKLFFFSLHHLLLKYEILFASLNVLWIITVLFFFQTDVCIYKTMCFVCISRIFFNGL